MNSLLDNIDSPKDLKELSQSQLSQLAEQIRLLILETVSKTGGHLASNLGVVELTIALHYVLNTPEDKLIWDVGHQCYTHKILTGRKNQLDTLRQLGGLSGFPDPRESEYDLINSGHSSTSISFALGLVSARDYRKTNEKIVTVIGDGALSGGVSFEALNNAGQLGKDMVIILNSNEMSISRCVGALSDYLNRIITNPLYNKVRGELRDFITRIPKLGPKFTEAARKLEEGLKNLLVPGIFFEELGIRYFGPIDGHDINKIIDVMNKIINIKEPKIVHVITKKGKGYAPAEKNPSLFHSAKPFDLKTGRTKNEEDKKDSTYTQSFSDALVDLAANNEKLIGITAAMPRGTGLREFARKYPEKFYDVGIAEQHALAFAAGLAKERFRPVVAIYSTFLQRGYDQIFHDIALQDLPVIMCLDRAGLVGGDGPTHHGVYDIAYLRLLPNLVIMSPKDGEELKEMLQIAINLEHPAVIRYPKAEAPVFENIDRKELKIGRSEIIKEGNDVCIVAYGSMVKIAYDAAKILEKDHISAEVINARFVKPLDENIIKSIKKCNDKVLTIEEGTIAGGFGSALAEFLQQKDIDNIRIRSMGVPDRFIQHARRSQLLEELGLTVNNVASLVKRDFFK
jgi:1-deoxy-D-xylulose-5-phosphate synthase